MESLYYTQNIYRQIQQSSVKALYRVYLTSEK